MTPTYCPHCGKLTWYTTQTAPLVVYCQHCGKEVGVR
jgi:ribosomal protein L33